MDSALRRREGLEADVARLRGGEGAQTGRGRGGNRTGIPWAAFGFVGTILGGFVQHNGLRDGAAALGKCAIGVGTCCLVGAAYQQRSVLGGVNGGHRPRNAVEGLLHALVVVPLRIFWASVLVPVLALSAAFAAVSFSANPAAMDTLAVGVGGACFAIYSCLLLSATSLQASATVARAATTFVGAHMRAANAVLSSAGAPQTQPQPEPQPRSPPPARVTSAEDDLPAWSGPVAAEAASAEVAQLEERLRAMLDAGLHDEMEIRRILARMDRARAQ